MGIGNAGDYRLWTLMFHISLPLMGIGNPNARSRPVGSYYSLPLMGIGNSAGSDGARRATALITPHGDRKRLCAARAAARIPRPLITPHGDRKPRIANALFRGAQASLPLMGIGNLVDARACAAPALLLITPHGDRKRTTTQPAASIQNTSVSLPLMGIGNPDAARPPSSYRYSSLPLMGIGNLKLNSYWVARDRLSLPLMGIGNLALVATMLCAGR